MSESNTSPDDEDMLTEYDLTGGLRGQYGERCGQGTNAVLLDPDLAKVFTSSKAVNELRDP